MPRSTLPPARILVRALLALSILLNGTALPGMSSAMAQQDSGMHTGHHEYGDAPVDAPAGDPADAPFPDCCEGGICECGCAAPAAVLRLAVAPPAYGNAPANARLIDSLHDLAAVGAPFRPPA